MSRLVFLDLETLGLTPGVHDAWEAAWAAEDGPVEETFLTHSPFPSQSKALEVGGYRERFGDDSVDIRDMIEAERWLYDTLRDATVVGANPAFDLAMLSARWGGEQPWHYRSIDIETYVMPLLGLDRPVGLNTIAESLQDMEGTIPMPDHTAAGDVECLRACYQTARRLYAASEVVLGD